MPGPKITTNRRTGTLVRRPLALDLRPGRAAFLWGPRRVGKTFWIREHFLPGRRARLIDLLHTDVFAEYAARLALPRERRDGGLTAIDEVQRVPALLDEVHWLIENRRASFLLTGSSARKPRRSHANLLAGRPSGRRLARCRAWRRRGSTGNAR